MSALKTILTASFCVRTVTTSTTTPKSKSSSLGFWNIRSRHIHKYGCRITTCAHILSPAHDKPLPLQLGFVFRGRHRSSPLSSSCVEKSRTLDCGSGSSSRSGLVSDMGSEMKHRDYSENDALLQKESRPTSYMVNSQKASNFLTVPTMLTLGRVAAVPLLVGTFYVDAWWGAAATTSIFIVAAVTDWLDGYIARKMKLKSTFGAFLDPVADKLMVAATLVLLCTRPLEVGVFGQVPWLLTIPAIAIIGREITMSAVREWAASQDSKLLEAVAVNNLGKWKTATQMTALTILLATRDSSLGGPTVLAGCGVVLLYTSAGLALWSLIVYVRNIGRFLLR